MHTTSWKRNPDSACIAGSVRAREGLRNMRKIWMATMLLSLPAIAAAQQIAIGAYTVATADTITYWITAGLDGALWFTELLTNKIGASPPPG